MSTRQERWTIYVCECGMVALSARQLSHGHQVRQIEVVPASSLKAIESELARVKALKMDDQDAAMLRAESAQAQVKELEAGCPDCDTRRREWVEASSLQRMIERERHLEARLEAIESAATRVVKAEDYHHDLCTRGPESEAEWTALWHADAERCDSIEALRQALNPESTEKRVEDG